MRPTIKKTTTDALQTAAKPVVHYRALSGSVRVGQPALVYPVDHPGDLVSNSQFARTSTVLHYRRASGEFETLNTVYRPVEALAAMPVAGG